jgi:hypothetical protein
MADHSKSPGKSKGDPKEVKEGTVLLTPEELRSISGGQAVVNKPPPVPTPDIVKANIKH